MSVWTFFALCIYAPLALDSIPGSIFNRVLSDLRYYFKYEPVGYNRGTATTEEELAEDGFAHGFANGWDLARCVDCATTRALLLGLDAELVAAFLTAHVRSLGLPTEGPLDGQRKS